jgi:hypothetical protein
VTVHAFAELVTAHDDAVHAIDRTLAANERFPDLVSLRAQLRQRLDKLHAVLSPPHPAEVTIEVLVPFVFFLDEYVQKRLATRSWSEPPGGVPWSLLQRDLFPEGDGDGGDVFFERAAELLAGDNPHPLVLQAYLVCLSAGFAGRHFDEPEVLEGIRRRLADRLPKPIGSSRPVPTYLPIPPLRPAWNYWLLTASLLVLAQFLLSIVASAL